MGFDSQLPGSIPTAPRTARAARRCGELLSIALEGLHDDSRHEPGGEQRTLTSSANLLDRVQHLLVGPQLEVVLRSLGSDQQGGRPPSVEDDTRHDCGSLRWDRGRVVDGNSDPQAARPACRRSCRGRSGRTAAVVAAGSRSRTSSRGRTPLRGLRRPPHLIAEHRSCRADHSSRLLRTFPKKPPEL